MSLSDLIKKHYMIGILGLALGCGDERAETPAPCQSDVECKGDRICVEGYCKDSAGDSVAVPGDDTTVEGPCGNSPLAGKYLWGLTIYDGMTLNNTSCQGEWTYPDNTHGNTIDHFTYHGNFLYFDENSSFRTESGFRTWELVRSFTREEWLEKLDSSDPNYNHYTECADFHSEAKYAGYSCVLSKFDNVFVPKWEDGAVRDGVCMSGNVLVLKDSPLPSSLDLWKEELKPLRDQITPECGEYF